MHTGLSAQVPPSSLDSPWLVLIVVSAMRRRRTGDYDLTTDYCTCQIMLCKRTNPALTAHLLKVVFRQAYMQAKLGKLRIRNWQIWCRY